MFPILPSQTPTPEMHGDASGLPAGMSPRPWMSSVFHDGLPKTSFVDVFMAATPGHVLLPDNVGIPSVKPADDSEANTTAPDDDALTSPEAEHDEIQIDLGATHPTDAVKAMRDALDDPVATVMKGARGPLAEIGDRNDDNASHYAPRDRPVSQDGLVPNGGLPVLQSAASANGRTSPLPPEVSRVVPAQIAEAPLDRTLETGFRIAPAVPGANNTPRPMTATLSTQTPSHAGDENPTPDLRREPLFKTDHQQNFSGSSMRHEANTADLFGGMRSKPPAAAVPRAGATVTSAETTGVEPSKTKTLLPQVHPQADSQTVTRPLSHVPAPRMNGLAAGAATLSDAVQPPIGVADTETAKTQKIAGQKISDMAELVKPTTPHINSKPVATASLGLAGSTVQLAETAPDGPRLSAMPESVAAEARLAPETSGVLRLLPTAPHQKPDVPRQIGHQIALAIQGGAERSVEIQLNPVELGRVRISMTPSEAGMTVSIIAERAETLDLMRRNADMLAQDFRDIGYGETSFAFDQGERQQGKNDDDPLFGGAPEQSAQAGPSDAARHAVGPGILNDRVDIRL